MKITLLLSLLAAFPAFADTNYNNFTGYNNGEYPFGDPNTATYGETFMAPTNGDNVLQSFSFYMAIPYSPGNIDLSAYIAPWTGTHAGTPVYISPEVNYANTGDAQLSFNTGGIALTGGDEYVMFLSVSQYYNTSGLAYVSTGSTIPGGAFVWDNNGSNYNSLFTNNWDNTGNPSFNFAVTADFTSGTVPEPSALILLVTAIALTGLSARKMMRRARQ